MNQADTFYHQLKQLRVAQGISLDDIADATRINVRFLEALEQGEFDILPKTYIRLFLRSYCQGIGADEQEALEQLEQHVGEPEEGPATIYEELSTTAAKLPRSDKILDIEARGPQRLRRDFLAGAGIFLLLIVITFFARRVYQEPPPLLKTPQTSLSPTVSQPSVDPSSSLEAERTPTEANLSTPPVEPGPPAATPPSVRRTQPLVPVESSVDLPDALFSEERITSHHLERVRLTPPVRLTLMARDNVVVQPVTNGRRGPSFNLTVAEARIWTIQEDLVLRTNTIERFRGDLNGVPIDLGQARGIGALRVTPTGEYEVFAYMDSIP
jgi:cytoskeletal protein RodZ